MYNNYFIDSADIPPAWKEERRLEQQQHNEGGDDDDDESDEFNPGSIVFYGRAELKTSDHRWVIVEFNYIF